MKRILYIAQFFPPTGGAGVQRSSKFVKYLPGFGLMPVVITGHRNPSHSWSPEDQSLLEDVPATIPVMRAKVEGEDEKGVDYRSLRREAFLRTAQTAIDEYSPELIFVTMSPFQDAEIAAELSRRNNLPWIADLRDPWALDEFQIYRTFWHRRREMRRMRDALASATGIIMNTPVARERLTQTFPEFRGKLVTSITNGFDEDKFPRESGRARNSRFRIVHTGTFHTRLGLQQSSNESMFRLLGRCWSGVRLLPRSPFYLLKALENVATNDPGFMDNIEVVFAGVMGDSDRKLIEESKVARSILVTGYVGHNESVDYTRSADLLFLPLHSVGACGRASIVPGKAYEYIASGNPILGALPPGDARDFVEEAGNCRVVDPEDVAGLESGILHYYREWQKGDINYARDSGKMKRFERQKLASDLSDFLYRVMTESGETLNGSHSERKEPAPCL